MQNWVNAVEVELQKARHEDQNDEYERGFLGGMELGMDTIKENSSKDAAKSGVESQYALFRDGHKVDKTEFDRGMRDGLKRVLELCQ